MPQPAARPLPRTHPQGARAARRRAGAPGPRLRSLVVGVAAAGLLGSSACVATADGPAQSGTSGAGASAASAGSGAAAIAPSAVTRASAPTTTRGRQLVDAQGRAVPWVADTAWWLAQRLTMAEATDYLDARARQGFTVIQLPAVMGGGSGEMGPVQARDGSRPYGSDFGDLTPADGPYWSHLRALVDAAARRGLSVSVLPAWSRNHAGRTLTTSNGQAYGQFLARLLADRPVSWMLGGDDPDVHADVWAAVERGIRSVDATSLVLYHPGGYRTSLRDYPGAQVAAVQTGHCAPVDSGYAPLLAQTREATDAPVLDLEPLYEGHPWCWDAGRGYPSADQVRAHLSWAAMESGAGVTYGHHSVWQFVGAPTASPVNAPRGTWREALDSPVAQQIRHLRAALEARPMLGRVPDDSLVTAGQGSGWDHVAAARDGAGRYLMAYVPNRRPVSLDGSRLTGDPSGPARLTWLDARDGRSVDGGTRPARDLTGLTPPADGDWTLIVDAPGSGPAN